MEFEIELSKRDWLIFQKYTGRKVCLKLKDVSFGFMKNLILWMSISIIFFTMFEFFGEMHLPTFVASAIIFSAIAAFYLAQTFRVRSVMQPLENGETYAVHKYKMDNSGIHSYSKNIESLCRWDAVIDVDRANDQILLYIDTLQAYIFPESQLENADELFSFIQSHTKM